MPDPTDQNDDLNKDEQTPTPPAVKLPTTPEELEALLEARTDEKLAGVKAKLDGAYKARDDANAETERLRKEKRDSEIALLEKEGKHAEALQIQLEEERRTNEELKKQNLTLSRDNELNTALASMPFRNKRALELAVQEITPQLNSSDGKWMHTSGVTITDFAKAFAEHEDNAFLFKQKSSSGSGSGAPKTTQTGQTKKLSEMTQDEVLKLAAEGKLPSRKK